MNPITLHYENNSVFVACKGCTRRSSTCRAGCEEYAKEAILSAMIDAQRCKEARYREDSYRQMEERAMRVYKNTPKSERKYLRNNTYIKSR